jgi:hypothetical protein
LSDRRRQRSLVGGVLEVLSTMSRGAKSASLLTTNPNWKHCLSQRCYLEQSEMQCSKMLPSYQSIIDHLRRKLNK